jgi:uncharacterized protein YndB with AHSA1/START domain
MLTDAERLSKWLLPTDDSIEPKVGHRFSFREGEGQRIACEVVEAEPGRRLAFTWQTNSDVPPSLVTWTITPVESGTRLRVEQDGNPAGLTPLSGGLLRLTACLGRCSPRFALIPGPSAVPVEGNRYRKTLRSPLPLKKMPLYR